MRRVLLAWIGSADLQAPAESADAGVGPIANAVDARDFDEVALLSNWEPPAVKPYVKWLRERTKATVQLTQARLSSPTNFGEIYDAAIKLIGKYVSPDAKPCKLTYHLSPGTPAMAAVWILLGKTRFPAEFVESSKAHGLRTASIPFDIAADFIPDLLREQDERLRQRSAAEAPTAPEFADILHRSRSMQRLIQRARRVAPRSVPVLIEGESGTGKEVLARAIHQASLRKDRPFIPVNCGAIPSELVESELFGHGKGAFTGATRARKGYFEAADGGTLFLDELGELPASAQVKLLRTLQEGEVTRLAETSPIKVDVRVIAATNRTLSQEISAGRFREDLFYRLAVAVLKIPPLRDRTGDLGLLLDRLLEQVNAEAAEEPGFQEKKLSAGARNLLLSHSWPGNVRELLNTLRRASIWSEGKTITTEDAREALLPASRSGSVEILGRELGSGFSLPDLLKEVAQSYLGRALKGAQGNKSKAANLVGLPSYQTFSNWLSKYEVDADGTTVE